MQNDLLSTSIADPDQIFINNSLSHNSQALMFNMKHGYEIPLLFHLFWYQSENFVFCASINSGHLMAL